MTASNQLTAIAVCPPTRAENILPQKRKNNGKKEARDLRAKRWSDSRPLSFHRSLGRKELEGPVCGESGLVTVPLMKATGSEEVSGSCRQSLEEAEQSKIRKT
ncbi:hypothetical protein BJY52DRAFT_1418067 [Lactarius psammicola]|nr:hypothetical protein BJY52DRAFT_1418067 [Lactarius psammicola]